MVATAMATRVAVPRLWPGATLVCLAPGPSVTAADVDQIRPLPTIVINDAVRVAPWAEVFYSSDQYWLPQQRGLPDFRGLKYAIEPRAGRNPFAAWPDVRVLQNTGEDGLEVEPTGLRTGRNSGYAAINLAVHLGAARILLLGYDMGLGAHGEAHFDGVVKPGAQYHLFRDRFRSLVAPLAARGVTVINCSRTTAVDAFRRQLLMEALRCA